MLPFLPFVAAGVAVAALAKRRNIRLRHLESAREAREEYKEILDKFPPAAQAQIGTNVQKITHLQKRESHEPAS